MTDDFFDTIPERTCCDGLCHQGRNCPLRDREPPSKGDTLRVVGLCLLLPALAVAIGLVGWWLS